MLANTDDVILRGLFVSSHEWASTFDLLKVPRLTDVISLSGTRFKPRGLLVGRVTGGDMFRFLRGG